ncbi:MAG: hypothetical protein RML40_08035, partial [Bacteroidota bacterium]|nr:hypothetical protein [Candidatus Kapabacteria bacterium]MDW8220464.1 hypothetical protein [Bacteroidota bacterium]
MIPDDDVLQRKQCLQLNVVRGVLLLCVLTIAAHELWGATYYWRAAAPTTSWTDGLNWSLTSHTGAPAMSSPGPGDDVIFDTGSLSATLVLTGTLPASIANITNNSGYMVVLPVGQTLTLTGISSTISTGSVVSIPSTAILQLNNGAVLTCGGAAPIQVAAGGTLRIVGNATVTGMTDACYASGSILEYTGSTPKSATSEFPNPMAADVIVSNTAGVTLNIPAATMHRCAGSMSISSSGIFILNPSGLFPTFRHENNIVVAANSVLRIQETMDLRALAPSQVTVQSNGKIQVQGQATASSTTPATPSIIYTDATSILEYVTSGASSAAFGTPTANHLVPATMNGSIIQNGTNNLIMDGGARIINGYFMRSNTGFLTFDATTNITFNHNIDWGTGTQINGSHPSAEITVAGTGTITGTLTGLGTLQLRQIMMNRSGATLTLGSSFTLSTSGGIIVSNGILALTAVGTVVTAGGTNSVSSPGVLQITNGSRLIVGAGATLTATGMNCIQVDNSAANSTFEIRDNPVTVMSTNTMQYLGPNGRLEYTGTAARTAGDELPATMNGRVIVNKGATNILNIDKIAILNAGIDVMTGNVVLSVGADITLNAASIVRNGSVLRMGNSSTLSNLSSLSVEAGAEIHLTSTGTPYPQFLGTPPIYSGTGARGTLRYSNLAFGMFTTGGELPATMNGNVIMQGSNSITLGADADISGILDISGGTSFTVPAVRTLTLRNDNNVNNAGSTVTIAGTLDMSNLGAFTAASAPMTSVTGTLRYSGTKFSHTSGAEFPASIGNLVVNRSALGHTVILSAGKTITGTCTITQGVLQSAPAGTSYTHNLGTVTVQANGRLRVQENSVLNGAYTYAATSATLEYSGTIGKAATSAELPATFGGSIIVNNTGHVNAPTSLVQLNAAGAMFTLANGNWRIPAGGELYIGNGVGISGGGPTSYIETLPSANGNNAAVTRYLTTAATWSIGSGGIYRTVVTGVPSVASNISIGYSSVAPTGSTDIAPFSGSASSPGYWYLRANPACNATITLYYTGVTALSRI